MKQELGSKRDYPVTEFFDSRRADIEVGVGVPNSARGGFGVRRGQRIHGDSSPRGENSVESRRTPGRNRADRKLVRNNNYPSSATSGRNRAEPGLNRNEYSRLITWGPPSTCVQTNSQSTRRRDESLTWENPGERKQPRTSRFQLGRKLNHFIPKLGQSGKFPGPLCVPAFAD